MDVTTCTKECAGCHIHTLQGRAAVGEMGYLRWFAEASSGQGTRARCGRESPDRGRRQDEAKARDRSGRCLAGGQRDGRPPAGRSEAGQAASRDRAAAGGGGVASGGGEDLPQVRGQQGQVGG